MSNGWTAEKFEPAVEEELEDTIDYCVYCYAVRTSIGCCGENHFMTGKELKEYEKELAYIDKRMKGASE